MAFDPTKYVLAPPPQIYFIDKDTGGPLSNGYVEFFKDTARTTHKPIFMIQGTPGSYTYSELPNPVNLTSIGTMSDGFSNDIQPYYYPFDDDGNVELYYLRVYSSEGVFQYDRPAWPNSAESGSASQGTLINYIPNGQLLVHNDVVVEPDEEEGTISLETTPIAPGGYYFKRPIGTDSVDLVTFERFSSDVFNPSASPRYRITIQCTETAEGLAYKDLRIRFNDVNKFTSPPGARQNYTFGVTGQSNSVGSIPIQLFLIKNFGTGGSAELPIFLTTLNFSSGWSIDQFPFDFGDNTTYTIGALDDDYLELTLRFPLDTTFDVSLTDFILTFGSVTLTAFPITTNNEFIYRSMVPPVPSYAGYDRFLPLVATPTGTTYDHSKIGKIYMSIDALPKTGELLCDGAKYIVNNYSSDLIPYKRLFDNSLWNAAAKIPKYGTGVDYSSAQISNIAPNLNEILLSNNNYGVVTAVSDGAIPTNFSFSTVHTSPSSQGYLMSAFYYVTNVISIAVINYYFGPVTTIGAGTSGITNIAVRRPGVTGLVEEIQAFSPPSSPAGLGGKYFTVNTMSTDGVTQNPIYFWFKVDGVGTDPAVPGRTGFFINVSATDNPTTLAFKIVIAMNSFQETSIKTIAASGITAGSYFNFYSTNGTTAFRYIPWYSIDGTGSDPAISGAISLKVSISSTDTAAQVADKTRIVINSYSYATPDFRGLFARGLGQGDQLYSAAETAQRYSLVPGITGDQIGTFQFDDIFAHRHGMANGSSFSVVLNAGAFSQTAGSGYTFSSALLGTDYFGGYESRPNNFNINYIINY